MVNFAEPFCCYLFDRIPKVKHVLSEFSRRFNSIALFKSASSYGIGKSVKGAPGQSITTAPLKTSSPQSEPPLSSMSTNLRARLSVDTSIRIPPTHRRVPVIKSGTIPLLTAHTRFARFARNHGTKYDSQNPRSCPRREDSLSIHTGRCEQGFGN